MSDIYEDRQYIIFNVGELSLVNFDEVLETSIDTIRKSIDQTKTFIKWDGVTPNFINNLTTKEGPYTYDEISQILQSPEWTQPFDF